MIIVLIKFIDTLTIEMKQNINALSQNVRKVVLNTVNTRRLSLNVRLIRMVYTKVLKRAIQKRKIFCCV